MLAVRHMYICRLKRHSVDSDDLFGHAECNGNDSKVPEDIDSDDEFSRLVAELE